MKLKFLGAAKQVTGSRFLLQAGGMNLLIDCGLFQEREFLNRNWDPFPVPPEQIDHLLLTHIHLDHSGFVPRMVKQGFKGKILTTSATRDMLPVVLADTARIQEEDAKYKKKRHKKEGRKSSFPVVPLYTSEDAEKVYPLVESISYESAYSFSDKVSVRFVDAGHILGSAMVEVTVKENGKVRTVVFSGDIGQWDKPIIRDPSVFSSADYIVMESTYGDREHEDPADVEEMLCDIINSSVKAGGNIVIPTFAIERTQEILFHLGRLVRQDRIPYIMSFLDSPMAIRITEIFKLHKDYFDEEARNLLAEGIRPFDFPGFRAVGSVEESKAINTIKGSCIIMAGSGMCTGGRIKHHLVNNITRPESTILFVGYQAKGTLGRHIIDRNPQVRIHGKHYPVKARIKQIQGFSAHADKKALLKWLGYLEKPPERIFLAHGEENAANHLAHEIRGSLGFEVDVPDYLDEWKL